MYIDPIGSSMCSLAESKPSPRTRMLSSFMHIENPPAACEAVGMWAQSTLRGGHMQAMLNLTPDELTTPCCALQSCI